MKGKRIMVARYGFIELEGDMTDQEALEKVKSDCDEGDINWGSIEWDDAEAIGSLED